MCVYKNIECNSRKSRKYYDKYTFCFPISGLSRYNITTATWFPFYWDIFYGNPVSMATFKLHMQLIFIKAGDCNIGVDITMTSKWARWRLKPSASRLLTVYSDVDELKHQSSASLPFGRGIHRGPVNSPHKWPVTRKMFPFHNVIMDL